MTPAAVLQIWVNANTGSASSQLTKLDTQLKATAGSADAASAAVMRSGIRMQKAGTSMVAVGSKMTKHVSLPLAAVGAASVKMALDFNSSMLKVSTQAGGTAREVHKLSHEILTLSERGRFAQGPQELSEALFHVESVGYRGAKAMKVLKAASDLATVGGADLESTTNALVGAMKTGIKGTGNMREAIGLLNAAIGAGNLKMEDLNGAIGTGFLSRAKSVGLTLRDAGAALGELTSQAVPANAAATRLSMTFSLLANPTTKAQGVLKEIGLNSESLAKKFREPKGLVSALELLQEHMTGLTKIEQSQLLSAAFGGAKSGGTIIQLLGNVADLNKKYKEIGTNADTFNQKLKETNAEGSVKLEKAWSSIQGSLIEIGNVLLPAVVRGFSALAGIADKFSKLPAGVQQIAVEFGAVLVVAGPLMVVLGKITSIVGTLAGGVGGLMEAGGGAGLAAIGGPEVLAAVAVVAALSAGLVVLYKHSKGFHAAVDDAARSAGGLASALGQLVEAVKRGKGAFALLGPAAKVAVKVVSAEFSGLARWLSGIFQVMRGVIEVFTGVLTLKFGKAWAGVKNIFSGGVKATLGMLQGMTAPVRAAMGSVADALVGGLKGAWVTVKNIFDGGVQAAIGALNTLIRAYNAIPLVPDIGEVGGGGKGVPHPRSHTGNAGTGFVQAKARGGFINMGAPSGDTVPAVLERGEYVLNRKAVSAAGGTRVLDALNFQMAPRFAKGGIAEPSVSGPGHAFQPLIHQEFLALTKAAAKRKRQAPSGGYTGPSEGPAGTSMYKGVLMATWVREALEYGARHGSGDPQPTSGYRSHAQNVAEGRNYFSEHEKTQYPGGAVDFGGMVDPASLPLKMAVVNATRRFKYPLLAPIGFRDDGHTSGTGHQLGGLIQGLAKGGVVSGFTKKASALWDRARGLYPHAGREMPSLHVIQGLSTSRGDVGVVRNFEDHSRAVYFDQGWARQAVHGGMFPLEALLHEWAHIFQKPGLKRWEREGGAEQFKRSAARKLFGQSADMRWPVGYRPFAEAVAAKKGWDWIKRGQFGYAKGGLVKGKVSWFNGGTEASGMSTSQPGMALNLSPGSESGWDNPTTHKWMEAASAGHPVYGKVSIAGHTANLPITDLGPAGFTGRAIDITEGGVRKLGLSTSSFPTDAIGTVQILGGGKARGAAKAGGKAKGPKMFPAGHTGKGGGTFGARGPEHGKAPTFHPTKEFPVHGFKAGKVPKVLQGPGMAAIEHIFRQPGLSPGEKWEASERALEIAGTTKQTWDDVGVQKYQIGISKRRKQGIQKQIAKVNEALKGNKLTPKQQSKLLEKRRKLYAQLGEQNQRIGTAREGIQAVRTEGIGGEGEGEEANPEQEAIEANTKAIEAQTEAVAAQVAAEKEVAKQMEEQTNFARSAVATSSATAWRALADILSGNLGAKAAHQANTAGNGSVGTF